MEGRTPAWLQPSLFLLGLAISLLMLERTHMGGDALDLLTRGWLLAEKGTWVPLGNPASSSAGGYVPGGLPSPPAASGCGPTPSGPS